MDLVKAFFRIDKEYKYMLQKYEFKDAILAIITYILIMILYYVMGILYDKKNLYLGYEANFFLGIFCIICVSIRKQSIKTIGFSKNNLLKSLFLGLVLSAVILTINIVPGISNGYHFKSISKLVSNFGYYFFVIALVEEIIFRGFIQTRIYGGIKNPILAVIITAFMFMMIHIPFQMGVAHMGAFEFIANNNVTLLFIFLWHIVFNFLYSKYNSIVAPTIVHAVMDWSNVLFNV
jgi:hypothetical protein